MHSLFARSHAHVLRRQDGANLCFHYAGKPYLIAFPTASLAVKIAKNTNQPDAIRLTQHVTTNLFANMSAAERAYWNALMASASEEDPESNAIAAPTDEFHVNFAGCLTFGKRVMPVTDMCASYEIAMDSLLEYPFAHNLGVALVRKVTDESAESTTTEAVIIEPNTRPAAFRISRTA
jgi:hypothetical protein